ncbi:unnamed protein product [Sphagnum tenellum]
MATHASAKIFLLLCLVLLANSQQFQRYPGFPRSGTQRFATPGRSGGSGGSSSLEDGVDRNLVGANGRIPGALLPFATAFRRELLEELRRDGPQTPVFISKNQALYKNANPLKPKNPVGGAAYLI